MSGPKITTFYGEGQIVDVLRQELPEADITVYPRTFTGPENEDEVRSLAETEIIFGYGSFLQHVVPSCPKLRWIQSGAAGVDKIMNALNQIAPEDRANITVTRNGETFSRPLAEYVISQILAINLGLYKWYDQKKEAAYKRDPLNTKPLSVSSVGILGLGCIGVEVARTCKCFGMKVWGMTRTEVPEERKIPDVDEYRLTSGLPELLSECDYIVNILPSTEETRGLLSGDVFSHCKSKKTVFINVGRGDITDEETLLKALRNEWLQHAVLDVHSPEPLPADSPLWREPGVIISPHVSGGLILHPQYLQDRALLFVRQYRRYINNEPLKYVVDPERGY